MAEANLTKSIDISVAAREIDFVTRFQKNWEHLREIMGVMRPIQKAPGTRLSAKKANIVLQNGVVGEGEAIPLSKSTVETVDFGTVAIEKYKKAVSVESINDHGYDIAVAMTDEEFLNELQADIVGRFYAFLNSGELAITETTWQKALAMAKGHVVDKFKAMNKTVTEVVGFVNGLDVYEYLGTSDVSIQTAFGLEYIQNFMGYKTLFLLSEKDIARGRVIAVPVSNIILYYIDPSQSDFARAGLSYKTAGVTRLIGFHTNGNYDNATSASYAIHGITLFAEYIDGIAVCDVDETPTLGTLTVASAAGTKVGDTKITVTEAKENAGHKYKYNVGTSAATVVYGQNIKNWSAWDGVSDITATTGKTITIVETDAAYKALRKGTATVTAKA